MSSSLGCFKTRQAWRPGQCAGRINPGVGIALVLALAASCGGAHAGRDAAGDAGIDVGSGGDARDGAPDRLQEEAAADEPAPLDGAADSPDAAPDLPGAADRDGAPASDAADASDSGGDRCMQAVYDPANPPGALTLSGDLGTHDPAVIQVASRYYLFQTGQGLPTKTSTNLTAWQGTGRVFDANPAWIAQQVPGATDLWAPDISYFGGLFHLYYSASTFGSNRSCIGHATKTALDSSVTWADRGPVVSSNTTGTQDNWNAIDPNVVLDEAGTPWLSFGSFWSGIKLIRLDASGARADTTLHSLASRPSAGGAVEAPFIVRRCGHYFLFASFDACCRGVDSTYKIAVGRSTAVTGPYADKAGTAMTSGGGTILVQGSTRWRGPGHNAVLFVNDRAYSFYHSYDANANGAATLRISDLAWDQDSWPISGGP